jgi:hypothetical protein
MNRNGRGASPETGAPGNVLGGDCWGLHSLSEHRAQRLASRHRVRPSLADTVATLALGEVAP